MISRWPLVNMSEGPYFSRSFNPRFCRQRSTSTVDSSISSLLQSLIATKMAPQALWLRALSPAIRQRQAPILRSIVQQRTASTGPPKLVGPMDNAFNRERLAVKHHAAQSAGGYFLMPETIQCACAYHMLFRSLAETLHLVLDPRGTS